MLKSREIIAISDLVQSIIVGPDTKQFRLIISTESTSTIDSTITRQIYGTPITFTITPRKFEKLYLV